MEAKKEKAEQIREPLLRRGKINPDYFKAARQKTDPKNQKRYNNNYVPRYLQNTKVTDQNFRHFPRGYQYRSVFQRKYLDARSKNRKKSTKHGCVTQNRK